METTVNPSVAAAEAHVFAPEHVRDVRTEIVDTAKEISLEIPRAAGAPKSLAVDLGEFGLTVHNALKGHVTGYILHVRQNGALVHVGIWDWAQTPADQGKGWNENTRMHVASVSKFLTALGMMRLLAAKGRTVDTKIINYLPAYWSKGVNIDKITIRHLLTHTSGFGTGGSATDFLTMKAKVAAGVAAVGGYDYENMNFGLQRILMSVLNNVIAKTMQFPLFNDQMWDIVTINGYKQYMQNNVFTPAGVANAEFAPGGTGALAYRQPHAGLKGWNSGDLATVCGGAGWRLSIKELLSVLDHARRKNTIIPAATTQLMLDNHFGIDQTIDTPAGKLYNKNGAWGTGGGEWEQCVAYFWPNNMETALYVNSPIGVPAASLRNVIKDAFLSSL